MIKRLSRVVIGFAVILAGIQLIKPDYVNATSQRPEILQPSGVVTPAIASVLERSCADCHSNATKLPWYGRIAPVSWLVSKHVREGRKKLNFSEWTREDPGANEMAEICDAVEGHTMPPTSYTLIHRNSKLSSSDVKTICGWSERHETASAAAP